MEKMVKTFKINLVASADVLLVDLKNITDFYVNTVFRLIKLNKLSDKGICDIAPTMTQFENNITMSINIGYTNYIEYYKKLKQVTDIMHYEVQELQSNISGRIQIIYSENDTAQGGFVNMLSGGDAIKLGKDGATFINGQISTDHIEIRNL